MYDDDDLPIHSSASTVAERGVRLVSTIFRDRLGGWIVREQPIDDLGVDAHIELVTPAKRGTGRLLAAQIKTGESYFRERTRDGFVLRGQRRHLNYYLRHSLPVLVVLCDPERGDAWWQEITTDTVALTDAGWRLLVPFTNRLDAGARARLSEISERRRRAEGEQLLRRDLDEIVNSDVDFLSIVADRDQLGARDPSNTAQILSSLTGDRRLARKFFERVDFSVHGYEYDSRKLCEIPEVRAWLRELDRRFPYWFYLLSKHTTALTSITFTLCDTYRDADGALRVENASLNKFMQRQFAAVSEFCDRLRFTEEENRSLSRRVLAYYGFQAD